MTFWPFKNREPNRLDEARQHLADGKQAHTHAAQVADEARQLQYRNHFALSIQRALEGR